MFALSIIMTLWNGFFIIDPIGNVVATAHNLDQDGSPEMNIFTIRRCSLFNVSI